MEYTKERNKDTPYVSVNTLIQPKKYEGNETAKEEQKSGEPGLLDRIISGGLTGAAWIIEKVPSFNFVPIPGFGFMQNFIKGMMVGSIERLSNEKVEHLWQIVQNAARAVTSFDYMKAYFWGFLRGFFGDFLMIWELPGTIKSTVIFIQNLIAKIKELSREDLREFAGRIDEIKSYIVEESSAYINNILRDIKAGKSSELIIETLKTMTNFSQDAGKSVGGQLTGVMLDYFSKDHKELGKDLGGFMGELSGTVAFTALLAAITAGVGSVWGGVRAGIKTVAGIIGKGVGQAVKAIGTVFKNIGRIFGTFIDGVRAVIKGFGNGASKLFKGIKGKLDEVLVKVKGLIDDVVEKISGKKLTTSLDISNDVLKYIPSSGALIKATPGKTTTILGSYKKDMEGIVRELGSVKSTDFGPRTGGFNVLNTPDDLYKTSEQFWKEYNKPWLDNAIARKDNIVLTTKPEKDVLYRFNRETGEMELTGFGREYNYLLDKGYYLDSKTMQMIPGK